MENNPIRTEDILIDEGHIQGLINKIEALEKSWVGALDDMLKKAQSLEGSLKNINLINASDTNKIIELSQKLEQLEKKYDSLTKTMETAKKKKGELQAELKELKESNDVLASSYKKLDALEKENIATLNKMTRAMREETQEGKALTAQNALIAAEKRRLNAARQGTTKATLEEKVAIQQTNAEKKATIRLNASEEGSYNRLSAQYTLNKIRLNAMSSAQRQGTIEGRNLEKQTRLIYEEMNRLQSVTGKHTLSVGNYNKATMGLVSTLRSLTAAYLSVEGFRRLGNVIFNQTKQVDSLNFAYEKIIPNAGEYGRVTQFLNNTAENYGNNINDLRKAYLRFSAASASSNLSEEQKMQIFDRLSKAAASLGLEGIKVDRMFNAIEQSLSKGTVSSEELRQQLGDSLPGSMEIMAKALGVTTKELGKMLAKGEVLSSEALPKFAAQLEKAYGIENVTRVETMVTAVGRFETAIINTVRKLEASSAITDFIDALTSGVKFIGENIKAIGTLVVVIGKITAAYIALNVAKGIYSRLSKSSIAITYAEATSLGVLRGAALLTKTAFQSLNEVMKRNVFGLVITAAFLLVDVMGLLDKALTDTIDSYDDITDGLSEANKQIEVERQKTDNLFRAMSDLSKPMEERKAYLKELQEMYPGLLSNIDLEKTKTSDLKDAHKELNEAIAQQILLEKKREAERLVYDRIADLRVKKQKLEIEGFDALSFTDKAKASLKAAYKIATGQFADEEDKTFQGFAVNDEIKNINEELEKSQSLLTDIDKLYDPLLKIKKTLPIENPTGTGTGNGDDDKDGKEKDPYKAEELRISAMKDGFAKELALLQLEYEKREDLFVKNKLETDALWERFGEERLALIKKYDDEELKLALEAEKRKIDLMPEGFKKKMALLEFEFEGEKRQYGNSLELVRWFYREKEKIEKEKNKESYEKDLFVFDEQQKLAALDIELSKETEEEKTRFHNIQVLERLKFDLQKRQEYGEKNSTNEIKILEAEIKKQEALLKGTTATEDGKPKNIYELLGLNPSPKQKEALDSAFKQAMSQLQEYGRLRAQLADQAVRDADTQVAAAQRALEAELNARNAGLSHNVDTAQKELALAKDTQKKATDERRKAQQAQLALQTVEQAGNLVTAATGISAAFPNPFISIPLIALMFSTFAAAKIKAFQLTKKTYGEGDYQVLKGGSHASGNDVSLGVYNGVDNRAEGGEGRAIFKKSMTKKYGSVLPTLVKTINNGTFESHYSKVEAKGRALSDIIVRPISSNPINTSRMEGELKHIRKQGEAREYIDGNGNVVRIYKNLKQTIKRYG